LRIGIYIETVKVSNKTGISRYVIGLVEALLKSNKDDIFYLYYQKTSLTEKSLDWLAHHPQVKHRPVYSPGDLAATRPRVWWDYVLPFWLWKDRLDVFHGPNHFLPKTRVPTVLTIHDLAYFYMEVHGAGLDRILKDWTLKSMHQASHIVTVSDSTKRDCVKEGIEDAKITTVYQGFEGHDPSNQITQEAEYSTPYILFLGTIQPRKNVAMLVDAFARISDKIEHKLILAGAPGESMEEVEALIAKNGLEEKVIITGFISDDTRKNLYEHADVFVYPSKYEGFGLVVLEAMSYGVPVITSNNSSLPEAAGDAAVLIGDVDSLADAMAKLVTDESLQQALVEKGHSHIKTFTWEKCAQAMMDMYQNLASR